MYYYFKAPNDEYFSVHIRQVGDWTNALAKQFGVGGEFREPSQMPKFVLLFGKIVFIVIRNCIFTYYLTRIF